MSLATLSLPSSAFGLSSRREARALSGKAFALSGLRGGIVDRLESYLFSGLFLTFALLAVSFGLSLR